MDSIYHIGIAQAIFAGILFLTKNNKSLADRYLIVWLFVIAVEMLHSLLNFYYIEHLPDLVIFPFAYGPCIYLYTKSLISRKPEFMLKDLLHFLPLMVFLLLSLFWKGEITINTESFWNKGSITILGIANATLFLVSILVYWFKVFSLLRIHKRQISDEFSYTSDLITLNWLNAVAWLLFFAFILVHLLDLYFLLLEINPFNPVLVFHLVLIFFMFSISFYGFKQPDIFEAHKFYRFENLEPEKYKRSGLKEDDEEVFLNQILAYMAESKVYLNRDLTLQDVSNATGIPTHYISQTINNKLSKNFFSFINGFRVEEAKRRILDASYKNLTLLAIAYDAGFNSKSSFNQIFKRETGLTPSEFKKVNSL